MAQRDYDFGVYIGRFQPLHKGHLHVIEQALEKVDRLILLIGSADSPRTIVNPFTFDERVGMITSSFRHHVATNRLIISLLPDQVGDDGAWAQSVREKVNEVVLHFGNAGGFQTHGLKDFSVALAGYAKDGSSYYLNMFPEWSSIALGSQHGAVSATNIRQSVFQAAPAVPTMVLNDVVTEFLGAFIWSEEFKHLVEEARYYENYRKTYGPGPFLTADCVLKRAGQVLLVTRGKHPGKGLLALPGGFVEPGERLYDAALRELREETGITGIEPYLDGTMTADDPHRSLRGRVVSAVYSFELPADFEVQAQAADDAADVAWYDVDKLVPVLMFEDHFSIIQEML